MPLFMILGIGMFYAIMYDRIVMLILSVALFVAVDAANLVKLRSKV